MKAESNNNNKYEKEQEALLRETNKHRLIPIDRSIYSKSKGEKELLKSIKKAIKNG